MKVLNLLRQLEETLIVTAFIVMVVAIFVQVLNRNFFHFSMGWVEELARYCMVSLVMFGTEVGLRTGGQISMEIITSRLKGVVKIIIAYIVQILITGFSLIVFYGAVPLVNAQIKSGQLSPGLKLPMYIPYGIVLAAFGIIFIVQITMLINMLAKDIVNRKNAAKC